MSEEDRNRDSQRIYLPKAARAEFQAIVSAFKSYGAAALPERYRRYVDWAFSSSGTSIEAGVLAIMIRAMCEEVSERASHSKSPADPADDTNSTTAT
jgi:hypothetical protein